MQMFLCYGSTISKPEYRRVCFPTCSRCLFSPHTRRLNTFLELKMENEVLQQRLTELRTQSNMASVSSMAGPSSGILQYSSMTPSNGQMSIRTSIPNHMTTTPSSDYSMSPYAITPTRVDDMVPSPVVRNFDAISGYGDRDEDGPAEPLRKKVGDIIIGPLAKLNVLFSQQKKTFSTEQHVCVTCGRTDSPEWRKVRPSL